MKNEILALARKFGLQATPESIYRLLLDLVSLPTTPKIQRHIAACQRLLAEMQAIELPQPDEPMKTTSKRRRRFKRSGKRPLSEAAKGSLHDKIRAKDRPSGKVMPRPRWAHDEAPLGGWDDGSTRIETPDPEPKRKVRRQPKLKPVPAWMFEQHKRAKCWRALHPWPVRQQQQQLRCTRPATPAPLADQPRLRAVSTSYEARLAAVRSAMGKQQPRSAQKSSTYEDRLAAVRAAMRGEQR